MKINKMKAMVGVLAVTSVASLVGSVSGTVAWLQYNTRARVEMYGTTAQTTENLQIRTIIGGGTKVVQKADDKNALTNGTEKGQKAITDDKKIYTWDGNAWGTETAMVANDKFTLDLVTYKFDGTDLKVDPASYGDWKTALLPSDISAAADATGHNLVENKFVPVTNPTATKDAALTGKFFSNALAGHEKYESGDYTWAPADDHAYIQFAVQFRTVDVDGKNTEKTLAQDVYLTDLEYNNLTATPVNKDVSKALRFHVSNKTVAGNKLFGFGDAGKESFTTVTHGNLDLDNDGDLDSVVDVKHNYSWTTNSRDLLDYGKDRLNDQTYYNVDYTKAGKNQFLATHDQYGALEYVRAQDLSKGNVTTTTVTDVGNAAVKGQLILDTGVLKVCTAEAVAVPATDPVWQNVTINDGDVYYVDGAYKEGSSGGFVDYTERKIVRGQSLGKTVAGEDIADNAHLTFVVTMWLEGWYAAGNMDPAAYSKGTYTSFDTGAANPADPHLNDLFYNTTTSKMLYCTKEAVLAPNPNPSDAEWKEISVGVGEIYKIGGAYKRVNGTRDGFVDYVDVPQAMWDELATVGAQWNLGMSFGIEALAPIQK